MDYSKLRGRIREKFGTEGAFSEAMGCSRTTLSAKLNNKNDWNYPEVIKACNLLDVPVESAHEYFFCYKS